MGPASGRPWARTPRCPPPSSTGRDRAPGWSPSTASPRWSPSGGGERTHTVLFDTGVSPDGMADNVERLGIDVAAIEAVVLSHGHFDHAGGFAGLARLRGRHGLPITVHPLVWTPPPRSSSPGGRWELPTLRTRSLEAEGFEVIERRQPSLLLDGSVLITGEVDRTTDFEHGMPFHEAERDRPVGARPADPRRPGPGGARPRPRPGRAHRVRPRRCREHRPPRHAPHRRRPAARAARGLPPDRARPSSRSSSRRSRRCRSWRRSSSSRRTARAGGPSTASPPALPEAFVPNAVGTSFTLAAA